MNKHATKISLLARAPVALTALGALLLAAASARAQDDRKLSMREVVALALQNSRDLALARVQYNVALNETGVDRSAFLPNVYTGSGAAYTYGFPSLNGSPPAVFQANYNQAIFDPILKAQQHAAEEHAKTMKLEIDRTRDDVIVRTASSYLELAKVRHSLELLRSEQPSAEKVLEVTRERVQANQELPIEVTRSELTAARVQERIIKLEGRDEALTQQIRNLTGIPDTQSVQVETDEPSFSTDMQVSELANLAIQSDHGIQEAENDRAARRDLLHGAKLSYWPTLSFVAQYSVLAPFNDYKKYYNNQYQANNFQGGVQINIPLFAAKTRANIALAKTQLQASEISLGNKRQEVRLDVQQKARNVRELDATREVARLDLKLAQETVELTQARFDQGRATLRDIEQVRLDESDKWVAFLDADVARQQSQLTLLQATGQLAKVFQ
jgi:outer membrane protein TolC